MTFKTTAALAAMLLGSAAMPAMAQELLDDGITVLNDCITECGIGSFANEAEARAYITDLANQGMGGAPTGAGGSPEGANGPAGIGLGLGLGLNAPQVVYLNFQPGLPTYQFSLGGFSPVLPDYEYTDEDKQEVLERIAADYAPYNFEFVLERPTEGDFVELQFNSNDAPCAGTAGFCPNGSILFGSAGEIDFGNDSRSVVAINDATIWPFLAAYDVAIGDPEGIRLEVFGGIDVEGVLSDGPDALPVDEAVRVAVINQSANTGAHELGHGLGLRHYDAWGPIGSGLPSTGAREPSEFFPTFPGPSDADETVLHLMASGASAGLSLAGGASQNRFFSERSAIKLAINERGRFITDDQANAGKAGLKKLQVVNPIEVGENADGKLDVRNIVVEGTLETIGETDTLTFDGKAGQFFSAEMISDVESFFFPAFDLVNAELVLYLKSGDDLVEVARNNGEFESYDAFILDAELPETGTYVLEMKTSDLLWLDFDGDGQEEVLSLASFGPATELFYRTGQYITNAYVVEGKPGKGPKKIGGPRKSTR
jgi:hypothetical protein